MKNENFFYYFFDQMNTRIDIAFLEGTNLLFVFENLFYCFFLYYYKSGDFNFTFTN